LNEDTPLVGREMNAKKLSVSSVIRKRLSKTI